MQFIDGGVTAQQGYFATGVACGIKKNGEKDLAIVCSEDVAATAGVFTTNQVKGHSLKLTMQRVRNNGYANALIVNSGNANACVGDKGDMDAREIASKAAELLDCSPDEVLVASTGVIGVPLELDKVLKGVEEAIGNMTPDGGHDAELAIMTTDTVPKEVAVEIELKGERVVIGGMAKGSGMIHPNMATMIVVLTTDANISNKLLDKALREACATTFNRVTIDGEMSVCDMALIFANGLADNAGIVNEDADYRLFCETLEKVCLFLTKKIAADGEGATKLIEVQVNGAKSAEDAYKVCSSIARSPLVKTMINGCDANWGRIITAVGYSGADTDPNRIDIFLNRIRVCRSGAAAIYDEDKVREQLAKDEVIISVQLNYGDHSDRMWTCDLSEEYIHINGSYRS
ncbi:MAG: bifunctional glutamate N-acetyltransferase/amino-acid acetyltransferase ArgJ [Clostridiales bacterium]|jgi:glutamate N-acetyltransferase/amino-acid N-acetyltransferase|nr:bifunctional glutamate N-acetyltransferase/amino-acid acetyltransferase ArgJ [Clostridiales bacterium]